MSDGLICRQCGKEIPADAKFCPNCGTKIEQQESAAQPADIVCPGCGIVNSSDHRFCVGCGTPLHGVPPVSVPTVVAPAAKKKK